MKPTGLLNPAGYSQSRNPEPTPALLAAERRLCALAVDTRDPRLEPTPGAFWIRALASLPPGIRHRYEADFEAAERYDSRLDRAIECWGNAVRALGAGCQWTSKILLKSAWKLEDTGRRLSLTH